MAQTAAAQVVLAQTQVVVPAQAAAQVVLVLDGTQLISRKQTSPAPRKCGAMGGPKAAEMQR